MKEINGIDTIYSNENYNEKPIQISAKNLNIEINHTTDKSVFLKFFCCNLTTETQLKRHATNDDKDNSTTTEKKMWAKWFNLKKDKISNLYKRFLNSKYFNRIFYRNNLAYFSFIIFYLILQILLIIIQTMYYINSNNAILVARAGGVLISFNMAFVLILISRRLITWLRSTKFGQKCLPLDEFIQFHKIIGVFILVLSIFHTIGHLINLCIRLFNEDYFN